MKPADFLQQHGNEIVRYERMRTAIAECHKVDEVKEIRNKAHAIEVYAAQAVNLELEDQARLIRLRAERRCGELIKEMPKAKGAAGLGINQYTPEEEVRSNDPTAPPTLKDLGISKQQSSDWQKLADIPEEQFEAALTAPGRAPSTAELIKSPSVEEVMGKKVTADVIFVWGQILDFERQKYLERDPRAIYDGMVDTMQADVERILPQLIPWLTALSRRQSHEEGTGKHLFGSTAA